MNGIDNRAGTAAFSREADPDFYRVISALRRIQQSAGVGARVERRGDQVDTVMFFEHVADERIREDIEAVAQIPSRAQKLSSKALRD